MQRSSHVCEQSKSAGEQSTRLRKLQKINIIISENYTRYMYPLAHKYYHCYSFQLGYGSINFQLS